MWIIVAQQQFQDVEFYTSVKAYSNMKNSLNRILKDHLKRFSLRNIRF